MWVSENNMVSEIWNLGAFFKHGSFLPFLIVSFSASLFRSTYIVKITETASNQNLQNLSLSTLSLFKRTFRRLRKRQPTACSDVNVSSGGGG